MESIQHPSLLDEQRVTRTLVDLTLENLSSLQPLERSVFELHKCDILQWLQELLRLDKAITESSSQLEVRERLKDSFLYRTNINKALSELDASLPCLDVITPVMTSTPSHAVPPAGIELARPKITCPTFNGLDKANEFALRDFLTRFEFCTAGLTTNKERLICLKAYVVGRPFHLIHHLSESDRNYHVAVNILKGEYWDKEAIRGEIFKRILNFTPKVDKSYQQIKEYLAQVHYELGELDNDYGYDFLFEGSGSGALVAHILFEGIPGEIRAELVRVSNSPYPSLGCILQGSKDVIKALLRVRPALTHRMNSSVRIKGRVPDWTKDVTRGSGLETFHADLDVADIPYCNFCARNGHDSLNCGIYPSYNERLMRCGQLGICEFCTVTGHDGESCPGVKGFRYPCKVCRSRRHLSSMCPRVKPEKTQTSTSINTRMGDAQNILPIVKITIKRGKYSVSFNCLVDSGSQRSYFSREVLDHLKCDPKSMEEVAMEVVTFVGRRRRKFKQVTAIVELFPGISPQLPILIDEKLNLSHKVSDLALVWQNLKERYELAAETGSGCVQLWGLMGVDLIQYMHPVKVVRCMNGTAWQTPAGIIPIRNTNHFLYDEQISPINPIVHVRNYDQTIKGHSCPNSLVHSIMNPASSYLDPFADVFEESSVDRGLEWMFSLESLGLPDTETISDYDHQKVGEFMRSIVYQDGHYLVKLPWHEDKIRRVHSNHHVALKVLDRVVGNLEKRNLYQEYIKVFEDQENEGIIEPLECPPERYKDYVWVPHRPVFKNEDTSTTKIRPVFNCSFKTGSFVSLNDAAYPGVNLTEDMLNLTLRFRTNKYVLLADIRKAFLMIRLACDSDKNKFCFFLKKGDQLKCYRYTTILFGFNASPFILNCVLKHHAIRFPLDSCSEMLLSHFYVDNLIKTSNSTNELITLYSQAVERLQRGGFELQSCNSNNAKLQKLMEEKGRLANHKCPWEKVLGYRYNPQADTISIAYHKCDPGRETKRRILSDASKVFDPLSLCLPVTIQARIFISELWKMGVGWDEIIPKELQSRWASLSKELSDLGSINFKRQTLREGVETNLFLFCDASKGAYGFAAYATQKGLSSLILSKAKVAPLKSKTLPTLELLAVFLAIKCLPTLLKAYSGVPIKKVYVAGDAQVVLSLLLTKQTNNKNTFAKNRLKDIAQLEAELTSEFKISIQYKYVPTGQNPADLITRGLSTAKLTAKLEFWTSGPSWVKEEPTVWPENALNCLSPASRRIVSSVYCTAASDLNEPIVPFGRYSELSKLVNVTAYVFRFVNNLRENEVDPITAARTHLIKIMQKQSFLEELEYLKKPSGRAVPLRVGKLDLFLDKDGVIRSGGRIGKVSVYEYEVINPILIAKDHPLTSLIILDCHKHCKHLGVSTTLNKVRMCGYWIPQGRQAVKRVLSGCALCQKFNAVPFTYPRMTDLPKHRVNMVKPFLHTGMDFTGHLWVLSGGERTKMYILVFTCLEVRAVHLELVEDMTAHSFLMAFIRFTNTYGIPSHVYSDNAKSFVAGCNIIHDAFSSSEFKESLGNCVIQHIKIPLHSPWCGGVWERLIKTIKSCLYKLIGRASYTYFNLLTILSDVQNAINDRPLTYRGSADPGLEIITPNHFLHPTVNPRIILRLNNWSIYQVEPPSRRQLLDSLTARDETLERFRRIWYQDYLLSLREHAQKQPSKAASGVSVGEIVIVKVPNKSRPFWVLGRVTCLYPGDDGLIRSAQIKRGDGSLQTHSLKHLHPLELSIEEHVNCPASLPQNQDGSVEPDDHPFIHLGDDFPADDSCRIWICPGCNQPDDGSAMVCCDQCDYWYHFHCVDMCQPPPVEEGWYCPNCLDQRDD